MKLFTNNIETPPSQLLPYHNYINLVSLTINNQKNEKRGETLSHHALTNGNPCCPIQAVVTHACDMIHDGATLDTLICTFPGCHFTSVATGTKYWHCLNGKRCHMVNSKDCLGFVIDKVGSHSLQASGTLAMLLMKHDTIAIQKAAS